MTKFYFLVFFGILITLTIPCSASVYMVGDSSGWDISTDLDSWVNDKRFEVGDVLMFQYSSYHSVCELTKQEYEGCNTSNAILRSTSGNSTFQLTKPGDRYFACGNRLHCLGGMKLQVHVEPNSTSSSSPIGAPASAPANPASLPRTSKTNNPTLTSATLSLRVDFLHLFLLAFTAYLMIQGSILPV